MNDRFKFRVWDKKNNLYFGCDYPPRWDNVDELYGDIDEIFIEGMYKIANDDGYVLEQCTGLKDKNGKLIYEGDIIRCQYKTEFYDGVVVWDAEESGFSILVDGELYSFAQRKDDDTITVIGNIHENPKLLEKNND